MKQALIVFAKPPLPGQVKTRLMPQFSPADAADFYRCMLTDILNRASSLPHITPHLFHTGGEEGRRLLTPLSGTMQLLHQEGKDLGERMEKAFLRLFAAGYDHVAIIGSDSPNLPVAHINSAFRMLQDPATDAVLGPTSDGGYYLIALNRPCPELFADLPWSEELLLRETLACAAAAGTRVALLPEWYDVDTPEDLQRPGLVAEGNGAPLTRAYLLARRNP